MNHKCKVTRTVLHQRTWHTTEDRHQHGACCASIVTQPACGLQLSPSHGARGPKPPAHEQDRNTNSQGRRISGCSLHFRINSTCPRTHCTHQPPRRTSAAPWPHMPMRKPHIPSCLTMRRLALLLCTSCNSPEQRAHNPACNRQCSQTRQADSLSRYAAQRALGGALGCSGHLRKGMKQTLRTLHPATCAARARLDLRTVMQKAPATAALTALTASSCAA